MSEPEESSGTSPQKIAVAAVLTIIFVAVLVVQFGGTSSTEGANQQKGTAGGPTRDSRRRHVAGATQEPASLDAPERSTVPWPVCELADVLRHDPFAIPEEFVKHQDTASTTSRPNLQRDAVQRREELLRKKAQREQALADLQRQGVLAVLGGGSEGNVAIVGSRTVRVGDEFSGVRVVAIEADGVVLDQIPIE